MEIVGRSVDTATVELWIAKLSCSGTEGPEGLLPRKSQTVMQSVQVRGVTKGRDLDRFENFEVYTAFLARNIFTQAFMFTRWAYNLEGFKYLQRLLVPLNMSF